MKRRAGRFAVSLLGAAATLLLHALFLAMAVWSGSSFHRLPDRPDAMGAGANRGSPEGDSSERRMIVRLMNMTISKPESSVPNAYLAEQVRNALKLEITGSDALALPPLLIDPDGIPAESSDAELIARTKLIGVYESQMRARIERAWNLPENSALEQDFTCRVLIRQHRDGRVREVELPYEKCDGTPELRQSVINAIFTASPLPAPPHPGVFVDSFSLVLRSEAVRR